MSGGHAQRTLVNEADPALAAMVGVTRFDLACSQQVGYAAQALARRWAEDRALPATSVDCITTLVLAAVRHGLRFGPKAMTITLRWLDPDRVLIDVSWHRCRGMAVSSVDTADLESTADVFETLTVDWGFGASGFAPRQWMVVDTR